MHALPRHHPADKAHLEPQRGVALHALLAPVYARFTGGFDTRYLIDAKALLAELR